ncbi:MAG: hypothetical protein C9356_20110 [Oleiphilus sp.]|nr:MAG: hypothetical protein C9356_20110 [Oleiphilus sp.]
MDNRLTGNTKIMDIERVKTDRTYRLSQIAKTERQMFWLLNTSVATLFILTIFGPVTIDLSSSIEFVAFGFFLLWMGSAMVTSGFKKPLHCFYIMIKMYKSGWHQIMNNGKHSR